MSTPVDLISGRILVLGEPYDSCPFEIEFRSIDSCDLDSCLEPLDSLKHTCHFFSYTKPLPGLISILGHPPSLPPLVCQALCVRRSRPRYTSSLHRAMTFLGYVPCAALSVDTRSSAFVQRASAQCRGMFALRPAPTPLPHGPPHDNESRLVHEQSPRMQIVDEQKLLNIRAKEVFMPALSSTMTQGVVVAWLKKPGDFVKTGEIIMTIESDKADMDGRSRAIVICA